MIQPNRVYDGIIKGQDNDSKGMYKVYIAELMVADPNYKSTLCKNRIGTFTRWTDGSGEIHSAGHYQPLQSGMRCNVVFNDRTMYSGQIIGLEYDSIPSGADDQEGFYLICKTKGNTSIYSDDNRGITSIMHNDGKTNLSMSDSSITMSVNEVAKGIGANTKASISVTDTGISLKFGKHSLILNESGLFGSIFEGSNLAVSKDNIDMRTENYGLEAKKLELKGNQTFVTGMEELNIKGTVARVSGGQQLSLTSNVVSIDSFTHTSIKGSSVKLSALTHCSAEAPVVNLSALGTMLIDSPALAMNGSMLTLNAGSMAMNAGSILQDGVVTRGLGGGASLANSMYTSFKANYVALTATDMGLTTALGFNDPYSGIASNALADTLTGTANSTGNLLPIVTPDISTDKISNLLVYIHQMEKINAVDTNTNLGLEREDLSRVY